MSGALFSWAAEASILQQSGCTRVFPAAFLCDRPLSIISYRVWCRTGVRHGKNVGTQGWFLLSPTSGLLVLLTCCACCRSHLPLAGWPGGALYYNRGFGHVLNPLQGNLTGQVSICSARDLASKVDNANTVIHTRKFYLCFHLTCFT